MNPLRPLADWNARRRLRTELRNLGGGYAPAAPVLSGTFVTPETALGIAAVYSAINVISRDIAVLPRNVYRRLPNGGRVVDPTVPVHELIHCQPNDDMDSFRWMQATMSHALTRGNGYSEIVRVNGVPVGLELLHPTKTVPKRTDGTGGTKGRLYYELDNKRRLAAEDCLHFAGMGFNGIVGFSPITLARQTIGLTMGAEQFGASYFGNGVKMSGFLKMARKMSEGAVNNLRRTFNQIHQGSQSAHQVGILEEGMDWVSAQMSPEDSQFLQTRIFQVKDIARLYSVPPNKIGDYSESHMANVEEANLDYVAMTLLGWVVMLEAQLNLKLLTREQRLTHEIGIDMSVLLRGNITARMARIQTMRNTGAWSVNQILISEGFNPISPEEGGDLHLVQGQYVPLDQVGKQPAQPPKPGSIEQKSEFPGLADRLTNLNGQLNGHAA